MDVGNPSGGTLIQFPLNGYKETGVTGALPATFTRSGGEPVSHRIAVRAA